MVTPLWAYSGFHASLDNPPLFISPYDEPATGFSAAMQPRKLPLLSNDLRRQPQVIRQSYYDSSMTFSTQIYRTRVYQLSMVPVTVDAYSFSQYRREKYVDDSFVDMIENRRKQNRQGQRRGGLGINIGLPKRLDKIFGEGGAGLHVTGFRRITLSGRSQWTDGGSELYTQSKFPSLQMEQISKFEITGTIGSKISVRVSQNSETDIPLANRIQIRYKGEEDEILQTVEAGNTTLSLPNTKFVGYSQRIQGLFGLKAVAQVGGLTMTAIASQEKGSAEQASITASGEENAEFIRDYNYEQGRIFDLFYAGELGENEEVAELYVYETETREDNLEATTANLWVDPENQAYKSSEAVRGIEVSPLQEGTEFTYFNDPLKPVPYVVFFSPRQANRSIGVYMVIEDTETQQTRTVGDISGGIFQLKLIRPLSDLAGPDKQTWALEWRNVYRLPRGISAEDIEIKIFRGAANTEQQSSNKDYQEDGSKWNRYIQILGLDRFNAANDSIPDGKVDARLEVFRPEWGLLIFPDREPFNSQRTFTDANGVTTNPLEVTNENPYDWTSNTVRSQNSEYYLQLVTKTRSSTIRLNRANIIEGSERVLLNGRQLQKGVDYNIQYEFGQVTLLTDEANDPNADVKVEFEYAPFFVLQKKTLFGARAEYEFSPDLKIGSTFLYKTDKAQERKPRVGQETAKMVVYDIDAEAKLHPNFLTSLADALPLVTTEAPSNLSISGEVAQSRPNPNVDNVAYVDDFEAALEQLSLGKTRANWHIASRPYPLGSDDEQPRGRILWHTPRELRRVEDVYDKEAAAGQGTLRTLRMIYNPRNFSVDTTVTEIEGQPPDTTYATDSLLPSWAGIMRYFASRVDSKRAQLFEIRMRTSENMQGKLHFDFGRISEDLDIYGDPDGVEFTEDGLNPEKPAKNGKVDEFEDLGLDGLADEDEPGYHAELNPDPNGDNWWFEDYDEDGNCPYGDCVNLPDSLYYNGLNGTEGNRKDLSFLGEPDEEGLSGTFLDIDQYYSFEIDFDDFAGKFSADSLLVQGSEKNGWKTYRIPIRDPEFVADTVMPESNDPPDWANVTHVRVWFESDEYQVEPDTVEVADWYFVQSNWQDTLVLGGDPGAQHSGAFVVASVSEEDNTFNAPPGVEPYQDPTTNVTEPQRGLLLQWSDLPNYDTAMATKDLLQVERYSGYGRMQMYVHGGDDVDTANTTFFFRLGRNNESFYEYQTKVYPGWDERNYVDILFSEMTSLKDEALRSLGPNDRPDSIDIVDSTNPGYTLRVKGNPNINEVLYFAAGVSNDHSLLPSSGSIWLDELRVTDVRRDVGTAGRLSFNGNVADLMTYSFSFESQDPYFRGLSSATRGGSTNNLGSGDTRTNMNYGITLNFDKFLPRSWGARLPFSYRYSKSTTTPLLRNNSDILLPDDIRDQEKSVSETRQISVSESFNRKGSNPLFGLILNRFKNSFSYSRTEQTTVNNPYRISENYNVRSDYDLSVRKPPTVPIFFWTKWIPILKKASESRLGLYPSNWKISGTYARSLTVSDDINLNRVSSVRRDLTGRMDINYKLFQNLTLSYGWTTRRDLSDLELVTVSFSNLRLGLETNYSQNFSANYDPRLLTFLTTQWNYRASYQDTYERTSESRKGNLTRSWGVSGQFDHMQLLGGKSSGGGRGGARGGGRRRNVRGGGQKTDDGGRPIYDYPLALMRFLTGWVRPFQYSYSQSYNNSVPGMLERPHWKYQFGLRDESNVERVSSGGQRRAASEGESFEIGTGFTLFGGLSNDVRFKRSISADIVKQGSLYKNTSTDWPALTIRISQFRSFPLIKGVLNKFISVFSPRTGYSRQVKEQEDLTRGFVISEQTSENFNPLLNVNFKVWRSLSLSASINKSQEINKKFNITTGALQTETHSSRSTIALSAQYSFSAPGGFSIPLFGKVKFDSRVTIDADVKLNSTITETSSEGGPFVEGTNKSDITFATSIGYTFSQMIKGGMTARWQDSNDEYNQRNNHVRELKLWAEIKF